MIDPRDRGSTWPDAAGNVEASVEPPDRTTTSMPDPASSWANSAAVSCEVTTVRVGRERDALTSAIPGAMAVWSPTSTFWTAPTLTVTRTTPAWAARTRARAGSLAGGVSARSPAIVRARRLAWVLAFAYRPAAVLATPLARASALPD